MNQDYSTGNRIVDEVGRINISGNIIPMVWFQAIRYPNGKPNVNAIIILADIVYWYRPTEIRDEITGQVVGRRKKFRDDLLQRSYGQISELFGLTKKQVVTAVNALEQMMSEFKITQDLHGLNAKYIYINALQSAAFSHFSDMDGKWNGLSVADVYGDKEINIGYVNGWLMMAPYMILAVVQEECLFRVLNL